jgi:WD40 repeat protein
MLCVSAVLQRQQQQQQVKREVRARYLVCPLPVDITSILPPTNKPNPKLGICSMAWSPDSTLLATVNENMPHAVWVWDVTAATLTAVLLHLSSVRGVAWSPDDAQLAVTTGGGRVYMWTPTGSSIVHIPLQGFSAGAVTWGPDGSSLVLMDKDAFCCAYITEGG